MPLVARRVQDSKLRQIVTLGSQDTLEEKTVTVCYGSDFVTVSFINFCATKKEIAQVNEWSDCHAEIRNLAIAQCNIFVIIILQHWSEELMKLAYNLTQLNGSCTAFLQKAHTKLCLQVDKTGKIPVKK